MVTIGLVLLMIGLAGTILALTAWGRTGFGVQDARATLRVVIPSATTITLGVIAIFSGLLTLRRAQSRAAAEAVRRELAGTATR